MDFFSGNFIDCGEWVAKKLEQDCSWKDIENLCVEESQFASEMKFYIEEEMWPASLNKNVWMAFLEAYKKQHSAVELSKAQKVIGIDKGGKYNHFATPSGAASAWEQYRKALVPSVGAASAADIEKSCRWVLNHMKEETVTYGPVKGLVTGSVQSGKTANMAGLVSMAADYDWNFFIILSGTIDNLRKQTRDRFKRDLKKSEGVFWRVLDFAGEDKKISESELNLNPLGKKNFAYRYVTVCLKNKRRLEALIDWLYEDEKRTQKLRIVVIDDEADQASINTAEITQEEIQERCAINQLIVNLVNGKKSDGSTPKVGFQSMNYISYTATPYANVLNERPGQSLYPKDFICTLPESTEYFGTRVVFGNDEKDCPGLGIVRTILAEEEKELKKVHKGAQYCLPETMKKSVAWFLCAAANMRLRPHGKKKSISMLVHTTAIQKDHFNMYNALKMWLGKTIEVMQYCEKIYGEERHKVTVDDLRKANPKYGFIDEVEENFYEFDFLQSEIEAMLTKVYNIMLAEEKATEYVNNGIHLCVDNCQANREAEEGTTLRIVYPSEEQLQTMEKDPVFIVIGGNTLSRGLTIDGLVCTYFSRNSNQADTLMQMARWFGYRKGYELLQRIWMTTSVQKKFEALAKIDMDMKEEIERFMERGISPEQFGPRIRNIPEIKSFRITSKKKSQQAEYDDFDFRGDSYETTDFDDDVYLKDNIEKTEKFLKRVSEECVMRKSDTTNSYVWDSVDYSVIRKEFLDEYRISKNSALEINLPILCQWIEKKQEEGKYTHWNVALVDGDDKEELWEINDSVKTGKTVRTRKVAKEEYIDIGSLRSGRDALADVCAAKLSEEQKVIFEKVMKSGKDIISQRSLLNLDDMPLILIYRIKKDGGETKGARKQMDAKDDIIGISIIISGDGIGGNHANSIRIKMSEEEANE